MGMLFNPSLYPYCVMDRVTIDNEECLALSLAQETSEKLQEDIGVKAIFEYHEVEPSPVSDSRNHIAAKTLPGSGDDRRLTTPVIGSPHRVVGTQPRLVAPVNHSLFPLSLSLNRRVIFFKPALHHLRILLIRPAHWLLRRKTPSAQVPAHRPHRKPRAKSPLNQLGYRFSSQQIERKSQLLRAPVFLALGAIQPSCIVFSAPLIHKLQKRQTERKNTSL